ncbi:unnamed protein product [Darwinula stevensoni]|uniref:Uncharacterized protein n=1 Tax=Darwinula stevensoni TaxID=69355 RepID=A0A7R8XAA1_9CRUS|nr:unnamed protein product [Darwinula stevensoni]CAG0891747.1 unnamed protein product [Darwinula stevensoni]
MTLHLRNRLDIWTSCTHTSSPSKALRSSSASYFQTRSLEEVKLHLNSLRCYPGSHR